MIHVLVAGSSAVFRLILKEIIHKREKLEWVGEAVSYDSLKLMISRCEPDIIIADQGLFDSEHNRILSDYCYSAEIPTIVFYTADEEPYFSSKNIKFLKMPDFISFSSKKVEEYAAYLEQLIFDTKCSVLFENHPSSVVSTITEDGSIAPVLRPLSEEYIERKFKAVLVGVSTGGPGALLDFLKGIGSNYPLPIIITQHIDSFFDKRLIDWLTVEASVPVHLAENDIRPLAGHVYFAPSDVHVTFTYHPGDDFHIILNHDAPVNYLRPAVAKMLESAANVLGKNCIAVILTGMGADGAKECVKLKELGAYTITQDQATSVIYGMPKAAYEMGGSCEVLPLSQISNRLWSLVGQTRQ